MSNESDWRYFELGAPPKGKFWCVRPIAKGYEVWFASHGSGKKPRHKRGQVRAAVFESKDAAGAALARIVKEKTSKGYVEGVAVPAAEGPTGKKVTLARKAARRELNPRFRGGLRLERAVLDDSSRRVRALLEEGISPNVFAYLHNGRDRFEDYSVFGAALCVGSAAIVAAFIEAGASLSVADIGVEPLGYAIFNNDDWAKIVPLLLQAGADPNAQAPDGSRPLHSAVKVVHGADRISTAIRVLFEGGADLEGRDNQGSTPLHVACTHAMGVVSAASALLDLGADPNAKDGKGKTPLDHCRSGHRARFQGCKEIASLLEARGGEGAAVHGPLQEIHKLLAQLPRQGSRDQNFGSAAAAGDLELVKRYLADGQDPDEPRRDGFYPIQLAGQRGHEEIVQCLLAAGARERAYHRLDRAKSKQTAKALDALFGQAIPGFGSQFGAETEVADPVAAAQAADARIAELLSDPEMVKSALNEEPEGDRSILTSAAELGLESTVAALIEGGAAVDGPAGAEWTPLFLACRAGHVSIAKRLLDAGADVAGGIEDRASPLSAAASSGRVEAVQQLLDAGADPLWVGIGSQSAVNQARGPDRNVIRRLVRGAIGERISEAKVFGLRAKSRKKGRFNPAEMSGLGPDLHEGWAEAILLPVAFDSAVATLREYLADAVHIADVARKPILATEHFAFLFKLRDRPESWLRYVREIPEHIVAGHAKGIAARLGVDVIHLSWGRQRGQASATLHPNEKRVAAWGQVEEMLAAVGAWLPPTDVAGDGHHYDPGFHAQLIVRGLQKKDVERVDFFGFGA